MCLTPLPKVTVRHQTYVSFKRSPSTPIAVTAAPAPAPCTMSGRGLYLPVWNMMILSDPPRDVANGWSTGYLVIVKPPTSTFYKGKDR